MNFELIGGVIIVILAFGYVLYIVFGKKDD